MRVRRRRRRRRVRVKGGTAGRGGEGDFTNAKHKGIKRRLGHRDEGARVLLPAKLGPRVNIMGDTRFCKRGGRHKG